MKLWHLPCLLLSLGLLVASSAGCGGQADPFHVGPIVPVNGRVLVKGTPLRPDNQSFGRVWFYPDTAKGNQCPQIGTGDVDSYGNYSLSIRGQPGMPLGWYKVMVVSSENAGSKKSAAARHYLVAKKYGDPSTSGLRIEVVENPADGAYDLHLKP